MSRTVGPYEAQRHPKFTAQAKNKHLFRADDDFAYCVECELPASNTIHAVTPGMEPARRPYKG